MPTAVADGLRHALPLLLRSDTWRSPEQPEAAGTILQLNSRAELLALRGQPSRPVAADPQAPAAVLVDHSVLIIRQRREVHAEIPEIIRRIEHGDHPLDLDPNRQGAMGGMGGWNGRRHGCMDGGMGGGFGGGFF